MWRSKSGVQNGMQRQVNLVYRKEMSLSYISQKDTYARQPVTEGEVTCAWTKRQGRQRFGL